MPTLPTIPQTQPRRGRTRLWPAGPVVAALAGLALFATACSSGAPNPGVAHLNVGPTPTISGRSSQHGGSQQDSPIAFSACMRSHGVPKFPDPNSQGGIQIAGGPGSGLDPNSPQFQAAQRACQKLMPAGRAPSPAQMAQMQQQMLRYSACMRSHGVPKFPDPTFSGGSISMRIGQGLDPNSPQFRAAQRACQKLMSGPGGKGGPGGFAMGITGGKHP
jgi:hypothetical protein